MRLDKEKMKNAIKSTAKDIKELKKVMRQSGHNITTMEFYGLRDLKYEATRLCTLIAHSRGHIHRNGMTLDEQKEAVGDGLMAFEINEDKAA